MLSGKCLCDGPITHPEKSYRLWCVTVWDLETSRMRQPWPELGCCARQGEKPEIVLSFSNTILLVRSARGEMRPGRGNDHTRLSTAMTGECTKPLSGAAVSVYLLFTGNSTGVSKVLRNGRNPYSWEKSLVRCVFIWGGAWLLTAFIHKFGFVHVQTALLSHFVNTDGLSLRPLRNRRQKVAGGIIHTKEHQTSFEKIISVLFSFGNGVLHV